MNTLESLRRKLDGAEEIKSVVRTMKTMAASNIGQYETAAGALKEYYHVIEMGIIACLRESQVETITTKAFPKKGDEEPVCAIVFGSDQGLVGQFNDTMVNFLTASFHSLPGKKEIWAVGERIQLLLSDAGFKPSKSFTVPNSVSAITPLVGELLTESEESHVQRNVNEFYIYHNKPVSQVNYVPSVQRLLPLDSKWSEGFLVSDWPAGSLPQVIGGVKSSLDALVREYLFVSLFKACAESLTSENASRLNAMQRAEKNIDELLDQLSHNFHRLRKNSIDEELFDVVSGFEALKKKT